MNKRPLTLADVTRSVVQEQFLHLVGRVEDEGVLEEGEVFLSGEAVVAKELVVVDHVDATVELLVAKLLPQEDGLENVDRVDL